MTMWMAYRIGIAGIAVVALIALFVCQYRLSSRVSRHLPQVRRREGEDVQSSDVANWN